MRVPGFAAYRRWRRRRLCEAAHERIHEIVDGELPPGRKRELLERHVEECPPCHADADTIAALKDAIHRVGSRPDPSVRARLLALLDDVRSGGVPLDEGAEGTP